MLLSPDLLLAESGQNSPSPDTTKVTRTPVEKASMASNHLNVKNENTNSTNNFQPPRAGHPNQAVPKSTQYNGLFSYWSICGENGMKIFSTPEFEVYSGTLTRQQVASPLPSGLE
jgi:hypothetical protein